MYIVCWISVEAITKCSVCSQKISTVAFNLLLILAHGQRVKSIQHLYHLIWNSDISIANDKLFSRHISEFI